MTYKDFPFDEVVEAVEKIIADGGQVFQKYTCSGCGARLTMDEPNRLYIEGTCDKCPAVTDIQKQGCNYMIYYGPATFA